MIYLQIFLIALSGSLIYRLRGAGWIKLPSPVWQILFATPYALMAWQISNYWIGLGILALTTAAIRTGHASVIDLGSVLSGGSNMPGDGQQDEWYSRWIPGSGYWHDFAGTAVSGLLYTLPLGIVSCVYGEFLFGLVVFATGSLKVLGYALAWDLYNFGFRRYKPTAVGEVGAGFLLWGSLALAAQLILL